MAQILEIIPKTFQISSKILIGFIISAIYRMVLNVFSMGRILIRWRRFENILGTESEDYFQNVANVSVFCPLKTSLVPYDKWH